MRRTFLSAMIAVAAVSSTTYAEAKPTRDEQVVIDFIDAMDKMSREGAVERVPAIAEKYWTEDCVQHRTNPAIAPGRAALIASLRDLPVDPESMAKRKTSPPIITLSVTTAADRVIMVRRTVRPKTTDAPQTGEHYVINIYRLEGGKIAENWRTTAASGAGR